MSAVNTKINNKDTMYYIHIAIMLFFMFGFQYLPVIEPLTKLGMQTVGIFLGLLWAWTFVDLLWPSLLGMVAVGLTGFMTIDKAFTTGFGNQTTLLVFFVFAFAAYLTSTGVCKTVAYWAISRDICIGKPYMFMFFILTACYILGGTVGGMASIVIGWAIIYEVSEAMGYKKGDNFPAVCLVGVVVASTLGFTVFPFRVYAVLALNNARSILGMECNFMDWVIPSFCASFMVLIVYILLIKYIFKPDTSQFSSADDIFENFKMQIAVTSEQKIAMVALVIVLLWASIPSFLPTGSILKTTLSKFSIGTIMAIVLAILYAIRQNGKPLVDYTEAIKTGVDWKTIIMLAGSFPIAQMMQSPESGVSALINTFLTSLLGNYGPYAIAVLFILFTVIVTQVAHNMVMMIVLAPILCNLSVTLGFNPMPALMMLAFAANIGLGTAGASVTGAMIFANREWIPVGKAFTYTWLAIILSGFAMCLIGIPLAMLLGAGA